MKKLLSLLFLLAFAFTFVACSPTEIDVETIVETDTKEEIESEEETDSETETEEETEKEEFIEVTAIPIENNLSIVLVGDEQYFVNFEPKNHENLAYGHKYVYYTENPDISDPLIVEEAEMLGKKLGLILDTNLIDDITEKTESVIVLDIRNSNMFESRHIKDSVNVPYEKMSELEVLEDQEARDLKLNEIFWPLGDYPVVIVFGGTDEQNAEVADVLYREGNVGITIEGGQIENFEGELVTD